jgi:hypothetical protein
LKDQLSAEYVRRASESLLKKKQSASVCQGQGLISFVRSSGGVVVLSLEKKYLEEFLSPEELKRSKVEQRY